MSNKKQDYQPILVTDPNTGELIDVYPFLNFFKRTADDDLKHAIPQTNERIIKMIRMVTEGLSEEVAYSNHSEFQSMMFLLFEFQKMFNSLTVIKKSN